MTEIQMTPTGDSSTRDSSEENGDGRFEHSDIRILNLFRISDFVLRICCLPRSKIVLGHLESEKVAPLFGGVVCGVRREEEAIVISGRS